MATEHMFSAAASSSKFTSSSYANSPKKYDVFLSFRGEDTRTNFTSHLYNALLQNHVKTYVDYDLQRGDEILPALMKAIEESDLSIIIFSEYYASSKWCLEELSKIMECRKNHEQVVIPVFYKVDPSHVRNQTGSYEHAFAKHKGDTRVNKWRSALAEAASLSGCRSQIYRPESEFVQHIVRDVLEQLHLRYRNQLTGLVGIDRSFAEIKSLLEIGSNEEVRVIGIWGMGGIGKTTLAAALYNELSLSFEGHCFLANVREASERYGLKALRNELFSEILNEEIIDLDVSTVGSNFVLNRLRRRKVFIVLDDVAASQQLKYLIMDYGFLGAGSRVIVTTRDKHVLKQVHKRYEVKPLNDNDSLQLFCTYAFKEEYSKHGYEALSYRMIAYCKGIPFTLKILGAYLYARSIEEWESELSNLEKIPQSGIEHVLKLSYDKLSTNEKNIFLDIACFYRGESIDRVISLLKASMFSPVAGIQVLLDKYLITISSENTIEMHDLIQQIGWEIVRQESLNDPGRRSRLWDSTEVCEVLKERKGTNVVQGIKLDVSAIGDLSFCSASFAKMTRLRFLQFHYEKDKYNVYLPYHLVCKGIGADDSTSMIIEELLNVAHSKDALVANLKSKIRLEWFWFKSSMNDDGSQNERETDPVTNTPAATDNSQMEASSSEDDLSSLEMLRITDISELEKKLPPKVGSLRIEECSYLEVLPNNLLPLMLTLKELYLIDCHFFKSFPLDGFPSSLRTLYVINCPKLECFSTLESAQNFQSLEHLCIRSSCDSLTALILNFFPKLKTLSLWDCSGLASLTISEEFKGALTSLESLSIRDCLNLMSFPIGGLPTPNMASLLLSNCRILNSVPISKSSIQSLQSMVLRECPALESLSFEDSSSLISLSIASCDKLTPVKSWGLCSLQQLSSLEIEGGCDGMESFPEEDLLPTSLNSLRISKLQSLRELNYGGFKHLNALEELEINACDQLQLLPEQRLPSSIQYLSIKQSPLLTQKLSTKAGEDWHKIAHIPVIEIDGKAVC